MKAIPPRGFGKPKRKAVEIGGKSGWNLGGMWVVCGRYSGRTGQVVRGLRHLTRWLATVPIEELRYTEPTIEKTTELKKIKLRGAGFVKN